jgi:hypothetical protein
VACGRARRRTRLSSVLPAAGRTAGGRQGE